MEIRKTAIQDIDAVMQVFSAAKQYMAAHGNAGQWINGYPDADTLRADINRAASYVFVQNGTVVGTFSLLFGPEPTYQIIKNGSWHADKPYATIHRLASDGTCHGLAAACFAFCRTQADYLRIDTHRNNLTMQAAIEKAGFRPCGTVFMRDGSERIAYDFLPA